MVLFYSVKKHKGPELSDHKLYDVLRLIGISHLTKATFTLIVNEFQTYVYVNDIYFGEHKLLEYRITDSGPLATAVLAAVSEGYGTRCKMTNVRAWIIDP